MSKTEILKELPKLSPEDRREICAKLNELVNLDGLAEADDEWDDLSDAEKKMLEERIAALEKHPDRTIPWEEVEARLKARLGK